MHRDYSMHSGDMAVAVFDDRVEIRSTGAFPAGITAEMLSGPHLSKRRNPLVSIYGLSRNQATWSTAARTWFESVINGTSGIPNIPDYMHWGYRYVPTEIQAWNVDCDAGEYFKETTVQGQMQNAFNAVWSRLFPGG
jgi:hypothetical protein